MQIFKWERKPGASLAPAYLDVLIWGTSMMAAEKCRIQEPSKWTTIRQWPLPVKKKNDKATKSVLTTINKKVKCSVVEHMHMYRSFNARSMLNLTTEWFSSRFTAGDVLNACPCLRPILQPGRKTPLLRGVHQFIFGFKTCTFQLYQKYFCRHHVIGKTNWERTFSSFHSGCVLAAHICTRAARHWLCP